MTGPAVVICVPDQFPLRRVTRCPTCDRRRRFAGLDAPWYGTTWTCCGCGDAWCDGERLPRPFRRAWRPAAVAAARDLWDRGRPRAEWRVWLREQIRGDV